jgi:DNA-binding response OmpR family regulator
MSVTTTGPLEIREEETTVLAEGRQVGLTVREFEVFLTLASRPDRVIQRPDIYQEVWNAPMPYRDRAVDVFVRKVRQKLDDAAPEWTFIHTHFGIGYRFSAEPRVK